MHCINNTACIHIVIHHYLYNWRYSTSDSHAWQRGLEAMAYVPHYLLYNVISMGARKKTNKINSATVFAIHSCLVTNKQFCEISFMEWNRFIYTHTYNLSINCTCTPKGKERKESHHSDDSPTTSHTGSCQMTDSSAAGNEKARQEDNT